MKKSIFVIIVIILVGGGYYLWMNRHDYFFKGEVPYKVTEEKKTENQNPNENEKVEMENGDNQIEANTNENEQQISNENEDKLSDILQNHCNNKCEAKKNTDEYRYCLEICGISNDSSIQNSDCDKISNEFEKSVCYKKQAIKEKNSGLCNNITDEVLRKNCKDRVIEELMNSSN